MPIRRRETEIKPETALAELTGIGRAGLTALRDLGLTTVGDLAFHIPYRYDDFLATTPIAEIEPGGNVTVIASVVRVSGRRSFRRRLAMTEAIVTDGKDEIGVIWFNQPYLAKSLRQGMTYRFAGKASRTKYGIRLVNPLVERADAEANAGGYLRPLMPVYPTTRGLSQHAMRKLVRRFETLLRSWPDPMPDAVRESRHLIPLSKALIGIHFPESWPQEKAARRRLAFDELLRIQLAVAKLREIREQGNAPEVPFDEAGVKSFVKSLPFILTDDQKKAAWTAIRDMERRLPMNRLLDGDVGSGKTAVAAIAMANAAAAGFQSALMAPTEILAHQHFHTLTRLFADRKERIALWTNSYKLSSVGGREIDHHGRSATRELNAAIASGEADIVIGTHALIEAGVDFRALGLAVVDEQHRFGVRARRLITEKSGLEGLTPHLLSMTATPIPRSLALTIFGDLDLSLLKQKPAGRLPIRTEVGFDDAGRVRAYAHVRAEAAAGRQTFVVCPLIDPSDKLGAASVTELAERLKTQELAGIEVGVLHGRLKADAKESIMRDFVEGRLPVLVATSVIEVGVDVSNATVMVIEGAERFGLAQLHQFRGRVGRGAHAARCFLLPGSTGDAEEVARRLKEFARTDDGFALAELDLKMRGPGEILGERQSGFPALKAAVLTDLPLLAEAKAVASEIVGVLDAPKNTALKKYLTVEVREVHLE
ncbi:MAG: ATP-dependent DNA helicase RecG [Patescibacteria group bacterium]|nr:ATP-dependent DNA helicase RecG [Patescibacteria group bacterium]